MDKKNISLLFKSKLTSFEKLNESFMKAKCYVLALGKNQNKSYFDIENVNKAYPSLAYVPVVGHLMCDDNGTWYLGGHDYKIDISNGYKLKSQCIPFGVAIPSEKPVYEDVVEEDGTVSQYLVCDVVIWIGRYPELADTIYNDEHLFNHSMEILYSKSEPLAEDNSYANIIDFSFDALCMLNKSDDPKFNVNPCFPSASFIPADFSIDDNDFRVMIEQMKDELKYLFSKSEEIKGGTELNDKLKILEKYAKTIKDLDFSIEELSLEELSVKMEGMFGEKKILPFSATYNQKRQALENALDPIITKDASGNYIEETYFWIKDFSDEFVYVERNHWTKDDYTCTYGRYTYTFDESTITATLTGNFEEMVLMWLTLDEKRKLDEERLGYEELKATHEEYKATHVTANEDVDSLIAYKNQREAETVFSRFESKIGNTAEFAALKENVGKYSLEELGKECTYIVGLHSLDSKTIESVKADFSKFPVNEDPAATNEPYNGLMKRYLNK